MRRLVSLLCLGLFAAACGGGGSTTDPAAPRTLRFAVIPKALDIPVFNYAQAMVLGADPDDILRTMDADWARIAFRAPAPTSQTKESAE